MKTYSMPPKESGNENGAPAPNLMFLSFFVLGAVWWAVLAWTRSFLAAYAVVTPLFLVAAYVTVRGAVREEEEEALTVARGEEDGE